MNDWITALVESLGYAGIALLMFLENIFPPIPSEVIMPLAGFSASEGKLSLPGVLAAGVAGTLGGAIFWYAIARSLGEKRLRAWADRHGRWLTLKGEDICRLETWFCHHHGWAVPAAHLVPGLRTLISIPAGIFAMPATRFIVLTAIGSGIWTSALGVAGYVMGKRFSEVDRYLGPASTMIMVILVGYYLWRVVRFRRT